MKRWIAIVLMAGGLSGGEATAPAALTGGHWEPGPYEFVTSTKCGTETSAIQIDFDSRGLGIRVARAIAFRRHNILEIRLPESDQNLVATSFACYEKQRSANPALLLKFEMADTNRMPILFRRARPARDVAADDKPVCSPDDTSCLIFLEPVPWE